MIIQTFPLMILLYNKLCHVALWQKVKVLIKYHFFIQNMLGNITKLSFAIGPNLLFIFFH